MPSNLKQGRFIVFEGIDGSGKTTQINLLSDYLEANGSKVHVTKEPTGRKVGLLIREVLTGKINLPHQSLAALFLADRYDHILGEDGMLSYLDQGYSVLCDRYFWSSFAYHALDLDQDLVISMHQDVIKTLMPDFTFYIDVPVDVSLSRIEQRGESKELFEKADLLSRISKNYDSAFANFKDSNIVRLDGKKSPSEIHADIIDALQL